MYWVPSLLLAPYFIFGVYFVNIGGKLVIARSIINSQATRVPSFGKLKT